MQPRQTLLRKGQPGSKLPGKEAHVREWVKKLPASAKGAYQRETISSVASLLTLP